MIVRVNKLCIIIFFQLVSQLNDDAVLAAYSNRFETNAMIVSLAVNCCFHRHILWQNSLHDCCLLIRPFAFFRDGMIDLYCLFLLNSGDSFALGITNKTISFCNPHDAPSSTKFLAVGYPVIKSDFLSTSLLRSIIFSLLESVAEY